jgi:arginine deiminase
MKVLVSSEIGTLKTIITSPPGVEFDCMVPENLHPIREGPDGFEPNPDYLLFDDLVLLRQLQKEHGQLTAVIEATCGRRQHITFRELVKTSLLTDEARQAAIDATLEIESRYYAEGPPALREKEERIRALDSVHLAEALLTGRNRFTGERVLRWPAPNAIFARDLMAAVGDSMVLSAARKPARMREIALARLILTYHPLFKDTPKIDLCRPGDADGLIACEGGDILVLSAEVVVIGTGSRTTFVAAERLAETLLDRGFEAALIVEIPDSRSAMHIDTLATRIDHERLLVFPPLVHDPQGMGVAVHVLRKDGRREKGADLLASLRAVGLELEPVYCGGDDPTAQRREQWSDGANAFALAPGVIVAYARNERTLAELGRHGYRILEPDAFIQNASYFIGGGDKAVIALKGSELVRGRGGPRCLTLPLSRAATAP